MWSRPPAALADALEPWLRPPGRIGLAVEHLETGETWAIDDRELPAASVIKVHLAIAAYQAAEQGKLALLEAVEVPAIPDDDEAEFDNLGRAPAGTRFTWRKVIDRMLTASDNAATNVRLDRLGPDALVPLCRALGLAHTALKRRMLDTAAREAGRENSTTAIETATVLAALWRGELLNPAHTAELLAVLGQQRDRDKLAAGLPADAAFAHKTGELPGYRHDAGIVGFAPGVAPTYVLVAFAEGGPEMDARVAHVATTVHAFFAARHDRAIAAREALAEARSALIPDPRLAHDAWEIHELGAGLVLTGKTTVPARLEGIDAAIEARVLTGEPGVVSVPCLQLRSGPGHAQELVSQLRLGDPLTLLEIGPDWTLLRGPDGYVAYGKTNNLLATAEWTPDHKVVAPLVPAIAEDGTVVQLSAGSRLTRVGTGFALPDGLVVRVPDDAVRPLDWVGDVPQLLAFARRFSGMPYLWGGASGWGVDCSGLVQLSYFVVGVQLPRDADQQQAALPPVTDRADLRPGDPVFFPGHVGLYLGDGEFIHATGRGSVRLNSFVRTSPRYDTWLDEHFAGGGRSPLGAGVLEPR
ncbi:MAG TPA: serine hydrolase [Oscillatoriaceae cyanobacterium]